MSETARGCANKKLEKLETWHALNLSPLCSHDLSGARDRIKASRKIVKILDGDGFDPQVRASEFFWNSCVILHLEFMMSFTKNIAWN